MVSGQFGLPVFDAGDFERAGGVEAVALGQVAAGQAVAVIGAVGEGERHDRAIEQAHDAAQRTHPGEGARSAPAHGFRPGEAAQHGRHGVGDQGVGGDCLGPFFDDPEVALLPELFFCCAVLAKEPGQRLLRRVGARAAFGGADGGDAGRYIRGEGDTTGAIERPDVGWRKRGKRLRQQPREIVGPASLHARRDFLAEQFQEKRGHA